MAKIETMWLGSLRSEVTHTQSGIKIMTDAPTDNNGKGEYFSPTDLVAVALGSCIMTMIDMFAAERGIDVAGTRMETEKVMVSNPRRIGEIKIDIYLPVHLDDKQREAIKRVAETCPVGRSLDPALKQTINFHFK